MKRCKKLITTALAILMTMTVIVVPMTEDAEAASEKYYLPTKVSAYYKDGDGKWVKRATTKFTYNKYGDVKKIVATYDKEKETETIKWEYKNGKARKAVNTYVMGKEKYVTTSTYDKSGKLISTKTKQGGSINKREYIYNKKGYVKKIVRTTDGDDPFILKYSMKYHKNGIPSKIGSRYNKKGLDRDYSYKYDKKGRPTQAVYDEVKIVYTYGKAKTTEIRKYAGMMDRILRLHTLTKGINYNDMESVCAGYLYPEHVISIQ